MMLPILISVSVAPGSYFFCAEAPLASAVAIKAAIAMDVAWPKALLCIVVLPDVLADGSNSLVRAALMSLGSMPSQYARSRRRYQRWPPYRFAVEWKARSISQTRTEQQRSSDCRSDVASCGR